MSQPRRIRFISAAAVTLTVLALAACDTSATAPAPPPVAAAPVPQAPVAPSPASAAASARYANVQAQFLSQGLLRTDGGGPDTPFTDRMLAENFIRIALYDEYATGNGAPVQRQTTSILRRWEQPVRVALRFGASVPQEVRETDTARVSSYLARLARITGHPIGLDDSAPNFFLYIVNEDERRALGPVLTSVLPGLSGAEISGMTNLPMSTYCMVYALSSTPTSGVYTRAFAVVRAEHPDLMRLSCIHEEVAQGLGLPNDSPQARPSIFNDDEEFALLTVQDEMMLRMLYNPALRPGMTEAEARPIIETLATQMVGSNS